MAAAIPFALAPALVNPGVLIDYSTPAGAKIYNAQIKAVDDDKYDLKPEGLLNFLATFDDRLTSAGWEAVFSIPDDLAAAAPNLHMMTTDYGIITLPQVNAHVLTYIALNNRDCQDAYQAYLCIMASITKDAKKRLNLKRESFTINGTGNGPLLLKVLIQIAYVDTRSTVLHIRDQLSSLDDYMVEVQSNIVSFNEYVAGLIKGLEARGEQSLDLIANLLKGYSAASDTEFCTFIKRKKDAYEEGDLELTPTSLMKITNDKYNSLVQQQRWMKPSDQDEKIIALQTKIQQLESKKTATTPSAITTPPIKNKPVRPAWTKVPPPDGATDIKEVDGRKYYWCARHKAWSLNNKHTTADCRGFGLNPTQANAIAQQSTTDTSSVSSNPSIRLTNALNAVAFEETDDE